MLGRGEFGEVVELVQLNVTPSSSCDRTRCSLSPKPTATTRVVRKRSCSAASMCQSFEPPTITTALLHDEDIDINQSAQPAEGHDDDDDDQTEATEHLSSDDDDLLFDIDNDDSFNNQRAAQRLAARVMRDNGTTRYVVKRLRAAPPTVATVQDAVCDLTCEALFLARLSRHANIITLRGIVGTPGTSSFMLILDRLSANLGQQIVQWRDEWHRCHGTEGNNFGRTTKKGWLLCLPWQRQRDVQGLQALYAERLLAALDIARALRHLHRHKILFRDIKVRAFAVKNPSLRVRENKQFD